MPTYDYKCENCGHTFEEDLKIVDRKIPTESPCEQIVLGQIQASPNCGGKVSQVLAAPYFGYDNIKTKFSKKVTGWHSDQMKDMKRNIPGNKL